jgi:hypothetical protein
MSKRKPKPKRGWFGWGRPNIIVRPQYGPTKKEPSLLWRIRRHLVPVPVLAWAVIAGLIASGSGARFLMASFVAAAACFVCAVRFGGAQWPWGIGLCFWLMLVAATAFGQVQALLLVAGWAVWASVWWLEARTREATALAKVWEERVAAPGKALPGSKLTAERSVKGGRSATIVLPPGDLSVDNAYAATMRIASAYEKPTFSVSVEKHPTDRANLATLMVMERPVTVTVVVWRGPDLDSATGLSSVGRYIDDEPVTYRWWTPGSGPAHDLISGTTGSGKSRFVDMCLSESRHSPLICDWVIDPQMGQSLPDWVPVPQPDGTVHGGVDWFAKGNRQGLLMLRAVVRVMLHRNAVLAKKVWYDGKGPANGGRGRKRIGVSSFTPTVDMPLLVVTIEEAHSLLEQFPEAVDLCEQIAKMARKCGIKLRLIVQYPTLDQIGNSGVLREMLASGNIIIFRTQSRMAANVVFQGSLPVEPHKLPRQMPDGSTSAGLMYCIGGSLRVASSRAFSCEDPYYWATAGTTTVLDAESARAAGPEYEQRHAYLFADEDQADDAEDGPEGVVLTYDEVKGELGIERFTCADLVLGALDVADGEPLTVGDIGQFCFSRGKYAIRTVREAIQALREEGTITATPDGKRYTLTKGETQA